MRFSETNKIYETMQCLVMPAPPLGDCSYCSLDDPITGTIASLVAANYCSSSDLSSTGLTSTGLSSSDSASSGLSSFEGTGSSRACEVVDRLGV